MQLLGFNHGLIKLTSLVGNANNLLLILYTSHRPIEPDLNYLTFSHNTSVCRILAGVFTFNVGLYLRSKWKQIKMYYSHYIESPPSPLSFLLKWQYIFTFHITLTEECGEHFQSQFSIHQSKPQICHTNVWWPVLICRLGFWSWFLHWLSHEQQ